MPFPATIFTCGVLCLLPLRGALLAIPAIWSVVATIAATSLGVPQDFLLPLAAVVAIVNRYGLERSSFAGIGTP